MQLSPLQARAVRQMASRFVREADSMGTFAETARPHDFALTVLSQALGEAIWLTLGPNSTEEEAKGALAVTMKGVAQAMLERASGRVGVGP